jgi:carboxyl-terminal processing protease
VDNNRKELLKTYPTIDAFKKNYTLPSSLIEEIKENAEKDEVEWSEEEFNKSQRIILTQMKALIARDLYEASAFYRIINDIDDIFLKGMEVITNDSTYNSILRGEN